MNSDIFLYLEFARKTLLPLPGTYEKLCFGTPAFYVSNYLLSRVREDGETITMQTFERDKWIDANPDAFLLPIITAIMIACLSILKQLRRMTSQSC